MSDPYTARLPKVGQERFIAGPGETEVMAVDTVTDDPDAAAGFWKGAWHNLRRRPLFIVSSLMILLVILVCLFPGLFAHQDPRLCSGGASLLKPSGAHWFGTDLQGCDIYARTIHGARSSVVVGVCTTLLVFVVGGLLGVFAGFFGGWLDVLISRITDIFFALPLILAAIVIMQMFTTRSVWTVVTILAVFGWPQIARIARGATISVRNNEFITASKALGASRVRTLFAHVIPNALGPVIVTSTISLGVFIVTEATLSYLGIGLPSTSVSWGIDISAGQNLLRSGNPILLYPAVALALTVLSFMMMGDALRDALDPKARTR
ncbi:ABC transporter permease [Williamsia sterculiae]|uniref:Oligopeptide transport system permease protein n=1 Tax=Williamsia sterculiae TaxID=1344003 RepID=A0A1N7F3Q4_9NOCA|nr:ABC transporter permease [Williamsia sterculiae]SIR94987.1 oligopeptide transport system permease protein [Williamsia sterculiae]